MGKQKKKQSKELRRRQKEVGLPAVIFSFDGTVMDTEPAIFASYRQMFSQFGNGRRFTAKEEERVIGQPSVKMLQEFFPDDDVDKIIKEYRTYQYYHLSDLIQPMPGIRDFLKWLKENHYPIGIISSRNRGSIMNMLEHAGLMQYIDVIIASATKEHEFSGSESLRMASKLLKKKVCIYIGHTAAHILNGHLVGAFTIAYNSNPKMLYEIIEAGPDFVTADYRQIRKLLEGEPLWLAYEIYDAETAAALAEPAAAPAAAAPEKKPAEEKPANTEETSAETPAEKKSAKTKKAPAEKKSAKPKEAPAEKPARKQRTAKQKAEKNPA